MGRESEATLHFAGRVETGKLLLEPTELILRGVLRARIPRQAITGFAAEADDLVIQTDQGPLRATLGAKEAALWLKALAKPPPSLSAKLGVSPQTPVAVFGPLQDLSLEDALNGATNDSATTLIAEVSDAAALDAVMAHLAQGAFAAFWGVTIKGRTSPLSEATLRSRLRAEGFIDTKSCSVSETRSATRFHRR